MEADVGLELFVIVLSKSEITCIPFILKFADKANSKKTKKPTKEMLITYVVYHQISS